MGNADIINALQTWQAADADLRAAIQAELDARAHLTALAFPSPSVGTNNQPLPDGTVLKGVFRNNYSLTQHEIEPTLKKLPAAVSRGLIKWKGDVIVKSYEALEPAHKAIFNEILTIKPGRPALEVVIPKER